MRGEKNPLDPKSEAASGVFHLLSLLWRRNGLWLFLLMGALAGLAGAQTFTTYSATWNGFTRLYSIYTPAVVQPAPALVMALHQTTNGPSSNPPLTVCTRGEGWDKLANMYGFLVLCPIATYKAFGTSGAFFWQAYSTDSYFPTDPDDSGYLASLIVTMEANYGVDPAHVFVAGMSSGGMMTQRMCIDHADLVAACAPVSGTVWVGTPTSNLPVQPVSILEFHGDIDPLIRYCGGLFYGWGESLIVTPSMDTDVNYWLAADGLPANPTALCTGAGQPSGVLSIDVKSADGKIEVEFQRELNTAHTFGPELAPAMWQFFSSHGR